MEKFTASLPGLFVFSFLSLSAFRYLLFRLFQHFLSQCLQILRKLYLIISIGTLQLIFMVSPGRYIGLIMLDHRFPERRRQLIQ